MAFVFTSNHYLCWGLAFLEMTNHLPNGGKQGMNNLFCIVSHAALLHLRCFYLPLQFLSFPSNSLSMSDWVGAQLLAKVIQEPRQTTKAFPYSLPGLIFVTLLRAGKYSTILCIFHFGLFFLMKNWISFFLLFSFFLVKIFLLIPPGFSFLFHCTIWIPLSFWLLHLVTVNNAKYFFSGQQSSKKGKTLIIYVIRDVLTLLKVK